MTKTVSEDLTMDSFQPLQPTDPPLLPLAERQPAVAPDLEASRSRSRTHSEVSEAPTVSYPHPAPDPHVNLDKRNLQFLNHLLIHLILRREVLPLHRLNATPTLPRHIDEFILSLVTIRTSCSGTTWASTTLCSGWTTPKKRPPTTHLTCLCGELFATGVHSLMMIATWCSPLPLITSKPHRRTGQGYRFIRAKDSSQSSGTTHKLWILHTGCVTAQLCALVLHG